MKRGHLSGPLVTHKAATAADRTPPAPGTAWGVITATDRWTVAALAVFAPLLYMTLLLDDDTFTWLIREEHPIELLGALALLAGSVICFILWRRVRGDRAWPPLRRLSLLALAVLFFFAFGEEESWGQRILGIGTPEPIAEANRQHELNFHNVQALREVNTLFQLFWVVMGIAIPLLALWRPARVRIERLLPVLPAALAPLFVLNQALTRGFHELLWRRPELYHSTVFPAAHGIVEIKESVACVLLAAGFWLVLRHFSRARVGAGSLPEPSTR